MDYDSTPPTPQKKKEQNSASLSGLGHEKKKPKQLHNWEVFNPLLNPKLTQVFFIAQLVSPLKLPAWELLPGVVVSSALGLRDLKRPRRLVALTGRGLRKWV